MALHRREFLKYGSIGGGIIMIATAGGIALRGYRRGSFSNLEGGDAFDPWKSWINHSVTGVEAIMTAGLLAASPHNTQPWAFQIMDNILDVYADTHRQLAVIDPFFREMHLGLGCAVENIMIAARGLGRAGDLELSPSLIDPRHIARFRLSESPEIQDRLFLSLGNRHTNRGAYLRHQQLPVEALSRFNNAIVNTPVILTLLMADSAEGQLFSQATIEATEAFVANPLMAAESHHWFRQTMYQIQQHRDGLTLAATDLPDWMVRIAMALPRLPEAQFSKQWIKKTRTLHCGTAPMFGLLSIPDRDNVPQMLEAGRVWQRMHLEATDLGLGMHPLNQLPEMIDQERIRGLPGLFSKLASSLLPKEAGTLVFAFRCGIPKYAARMSPRRTLQDVARYL